MAVYCVSGVTLNNYVYTDCCGNFNYGDTALPYTITFDLNSFYQNVNILNDDEVITQCPTSTPTPTPTLTPSNTPTPTNPTTPSTLTGKIVTYDYNTCEIYTNYPMGISCEILQEVDVFTNTGGIIRINITGGTSPYNVLWANGVREKILFNVSSGSYPVTVIDYYGDYTATTVCSIGRNLPNCDLNGVATYLVPPKV
jgi:hypothetical protein